MRGIHAIESVVVLVCALAALPAAQAPRPTDGGRQVFARSAQYPLLPQVLELELALSAAPKHLRDSSTVWTLEKNGLHDGADKARMPSRAWSAAVAAISSQFAGTRKAHGRCCPSTSTMLRCDCRESRVPRSTRPSHSDSRADNIGHPRERVSPTCWRRCDTGSTSRAT